ncbi:hypothetical protein B1987_22505 [Mycobacterium kansasii]|uniref:Putative PPE family protein PPE47/PPE48 n=1 Tax=Mycobacterium attenuatum TaxID=2341086 RepID=A0A498PUL1_9MYCO|nr:PPE family protein [Mycobacterium attenuatum]ORB86083.1 hypothetical protein B1987_22505 [Mycobacterium kansasii]VBA36597.1 putative PPE family protein PPE47/PPE48 [Mycobacterium attenuatum]
MSAPIWMACPPEVHSALLSAGPGPAALAAAAAEWSSLSAQYAAAAEQLTTVVAGMSGAWQGVSAQLCAAAYLPYVAWLTQASADSAATAVAHESAASAYVGAVAAMPTLGELSANHVVHAVLAATNFFGINTIPIAVNEADYVRMWVQAATTMGVYEAVTAAALVSAPRTIPAPVIVKPGSTIAATAAQTATLTPFPWEEIAQLLQYVGHLMAEILPGLLSEIIPMGFALLWLALDVLTLNLIGVIIVFAENIPIFIDFAINCLWLTYFFWYGFFGVVKIVLDWVFGNLFAFSPLLAGLGGGLSSELAGAAGTSLVGLTHVAAPVMAVAAPVAATQVAAVEQVGGASATVAPAQLVSVSAHGVGSLGFAGTVQQGVGVQAGGLATVRGGEAGYGALVPMLPTNWHTDLAGSAIGKELVGVMV